MKYKCVDTGENRCITKGKIYEGELDKTEANGIRIVENDYGYDDWYFSYRFVPYIEETVEVNDE